MSPRFARISFVIRRNPVVFATACWMTRSATVGIPKGLCFPFGFGIYTLLTGIGRYCLFIIFEINSSRYCSNHRSTSCTVILSTPGAPLFCLTFLIAIFKFFSLKISSINFICCSSTIRKFIRNHPHYLCHLWLRSIVPGYPRFWTIQTLLIAIRTL